MAGTGVGCPTPPRALAAPCVPSACRADNGLTVALLRAAVAWRSHRTHPPRVTMPKESRRRKKDPRKPKRGKSAFLLFSQYTRPTVVAEMPDLAFPDIAREVARRWKLIDGDEKAVRGAVTASCCAVALPCPSSIADAPGVVFAFCCVWFVQLAGARLSGSRSLRRRPRPTASATTRR